MGDSLIEIGEEAVTAIKSSSSSSSNKILNYPQSLVTEKIIFCIDALLIEKDEALARTIFNMLRTYIYLKKEISTKPPEFECLIIIDDDGTTSHRTINTEKDIQLSLSFTENIDIQLDKGPLKVDNVFDKIASLVELPDPETYENCLPPPCIYHVIWLFGHNLFVPTMNNLNPFNFLMMTPFFALDILYIYDNTLQDNCSKKICYTLLHFNDNGKGYFLNCRYDDLAKISACFAQFLGHPLIRAPQNEAKFNIIDLIPQTLEDK